MLHNRTQVCDHLPLRSWGCSACGHCGYAGQCSTWWQRRPGRSQHRCSWKESCWLSTNTEHGPDITQQTEAAVPLWHTTTTPRVLTSRFTSQLIPHWPHTVENPFTVSLPRMNHLLFQSLLLCAAGLKKKKRDITRNSFQVTWLLLLFWGVKCFPCGVCPLPVTLYMWLCLDTYVIPLL